MRLPVSNSPRGPINSFTAVGCTSGRKVTITRNDLAAMKLLGTQRKVWRGEPAATPTISAGRRSLAARACSSNCVPTGSVVKPSIAEAVPLVTRSAVRSTRNGLPFTGAGGPSLPLVDEAPSVVFGPVVVGPGRVGRPVGEGAG